ncbi:hypothetical protein B0A49_09752, partial [Cryomyces minteri]
MLPLTTLVCLLAALPSTYAWGVLGHDTVAFIASHYVTPTTTKWAQSILNDTSSAYLENVANWADSYRSTAEGAFSAPFHYIDAEDNPPAACSVNYTRDCGAAGCVVSAIANYTIRVQETRRLAPLQVNYALRWIVHFIGDIHQPLHDEAIDVGGNTIPVLFDNATTNLHHIWDTNMPEKLIGGYTLADAKGWAANLTAAIQHGEYTKLRAGWLKGIDIKDPVGSAMVWARDTNAFVCSTVLSDGVAAVNGTQLDGPYYDKSVPVIKLQIAKAGYRLAAWLNLLAEGHAGWANGPKMKDKNDEGLENRKMDLRGADLLPKRSAGELLKDIKIHAGTDQILESVLDGGYLPQSIIRIGIRRQLAQRINEIKTTSLEEAYKSKMKYVELLRTRPIAIETATANEQHYEVGTGVLSACLGPRMKYSCCLYPKGSETSAQAEVAMLETYVQKAQLKDGQSILDLGCGWGSGALYFAEVFPNSRITAFSNSRTQKQYIDSKASSLGLKNLTVITGDIASDYEFPPSSFDRVVSIELFEHMKNYELLMAKVARALKPGGKLFVHIFAHKSMPYDFETGWMTEHFFTGGTMPSTDLLHFFQKDLNLQQQWWVNGKHYAKTCEDWLSKMNASKVEIWPHLEETYGKNNVTTWFHRWQIFYMACAELFAYEGGETWGVSHYLFEKAH